MVSRKKLLATIVFAAMGVAGWWLTSRDEAPPAPPTAVTSVPAAPASPPPATTSPAQNASAAAAPLVPQVFRYQRYDVDTGRNDPEVCLVFSAALKPAADSYATFLNFSGGPVTPLRVDDKKLCFGGLRYGESYSMTLRAGLPDKAGEALVEDTVIPLSLGDRAPQVILGKGFWLPRDGNGSLPITSVNVERVRMSIYRVGERALTRMESLFLDDGAISRYRVEEDLDLAASKVWQQDLPLRTPRNQGTATNLPLPDVVLKGAPGAYWVQVLPIDLNGEPVGEEDYSLPGQWVISSDLAMTTYRGGESGLVVMMRGLASAKPKAGVELTLLAANNEILGTSTSDQDGKASFAAGLMRGHGGMEPVMLLARQGEDFNLLDLRRSSFDLSDRGVQGREAAGPIDAFLYTERGIYRPGETVYLTALLRDARANLLPGQGTWYIKLFRPNGEEYRSWPVKQTDNGAVTLAVALPKSANLGVWDAQIYGDPKGEAVGKVSFEVDTFVPQRLEVTVTPPSEPVAVGAEVQVPVFARFLYGAVGSGLGGEASLDVAVDPRPFPQHRGYRWGVEGEQVEAVSLPLTLEDTDADGKTVATGLLNDIPKATRPLRGVVQVEIAEPGGRATAKQADVPLASAPLFIGIRPLFEGVSVREGTEAGFSVLTVDGQGKPLGQQKLTYHLIEVKTDWQWYKSGSSWSYKQIRREREVAQGHLVSGADDGLTTVRQTLPWGRYRLEVQQDDGEMRATRDFTSGWYGEDSSDTPDQLAVSSDKTGYGAGEQARLHIASDSAGEATIVIANEAVQETHIVSVPAGGVDVPITMQESWAAGAYALVSFYRPLGREVNHAPVRAVGVVWLGVDRAQRSLTVDISAPALVSPRQTITIPVAVKGLSDGQNSAYVTLAAVDQGILQLTDFKTPDPLTHYFRQRRLGVDMTDDYGRIIRPQAADGSDQGGDAGHGQGLETVPVRSVALFSGLVALKPDGTADIPLEIPDFQGELRLMAVAYDRGKVGSSEQRMTVRDPVVADVILPRFIGSGDQGAATVLLHNVAGQAGDYQVTVQAEGPISGGQPTSTVSLAAGQRMTYTVPLRGAAQNPQPGASPLGIGTVRLSVQGPGGFAISRDWPIQVRAPQAVLSQQERGTLAPGERKVIHGVAGVPLQAGTISASLSTSRWLGLDVPALLKSLDRYPYGCLEQTVSRAMPLLAFNELAGQVLEQQDIGIPQRIDQAIERVLSMQVAADYYEDPLNFATWGGNGDDVQRWMTIYAADFLLQAAERGYDVPANVQDVLLKGLIAQSHASDRSSEDARAYAMAILARFGRLNRQEAVYVHDERQPASIRALLFMGLTFEALKDQARANNSFDLALNHFRQIPQLQIQISQLRQELGAWQGKKDGKAHEALKEKYSTAVNTLRGYLSYDSNGGSNGENSVPPSRVTILYTMIGALAQSNRLTAIPDLLDIGQQETGTLAYLSTEEKAAMLYAASQLARSSGRVDVQVDGTAIGKGDPASRRLDEAALQAGVTVENRGDGPIFYSLSVDGIPSEPLPAQDMDLHVEKAFFTPTGEPLDPTTLHRNQRAVVVINGSTTSQEDGSYGMQDLLPAGLEVEGIVDAGTAGFGWLNLTSSLISQQASDDRVVAVTVLPRSASELTETLEGYEELPADEQLRQQWSFRVAYVVRAVTPGSFTLPAVSAEHMTVLKVQARSAMGQVVIAE